MAGKTKAPGTAAITIPRLAVDRTQLVLVGRSDLMVHKFEQKSLMQIYLKNRNLQGKIKQRGHVARDPFQEWRGAMYVDLQDNPCFPVVALKKAAKSAAATLYEGVTGTAVSKNLFFPGEAARIYAEEIIYREDVVRIGGKGPGTGTVDLRYRPSFRNWWAIVDVEFGRDFGLESTMALIESAGERIGIFEWRPEKDGEFGRYSIANAAEAKDLIARAEKFDGFKESFQTQTFEVPEGMLDSLDTPFYLSDIGIDDVEIDVEAGLRSAAA